LIRQGDSNFSGLNHPVCYVGHEKPTSFPLFKGGCQQIIKFSSFDLKVNS
jgi:hypothetical protein